MTHLQIGSININNGINYALLQNWRPRVAQVRRDGTFIDVIEEIPIRIFGESEGEALNALSALGEELLKIMLFEDGGGVVVLQYQPFGAAAIWRSACVDLPNGVDFLELPVTFNENIQAYEINPVTISVQRRGEWLLQHDGNPVLNSSFEVFSGGNFTSWGQVNSPTISQSGLTPRFGNFVANIKNTSTAAVRGIWQDVAVPLGWGEARITVWARAINGEGRLQIYDIGGFADPTPAVVITSTAWQEYTVIRSLGTAGVRVLLAAQSAGAEILFDGAKVQPATENQPYTLASNLGDFQATAAAVTNGNIATVPLTSARGMPSPVRLDLESFRIGGDIPGGYLLLTDGVGDIAIVESQAFPAGGTFAHVADAANFARGGSYLRFTPAAANTIYSVDLAGTSLDLNVAARRVAAFINVRAFPGLSENPVFRVRLLLEIGGTGAHRVTTPWMIVTRQANPEGPDWNARQSPLVISYGAIINTLSLQFTAESTGGTLGLDSIVLLNLTNPASYVIALPKNTSAVINSPLRVDHRLLSHPQPLVAQMSNATSDIITNTLPYRGIAQMFTKGATVYGAWLATGGVDSGSSGTNWRVTQAGTLITNNWHIQRLIASLVPR